MLHTVLQRAYGAVALPHLHRLLGGLVEGHEDGGGGGHTRQVAPHACRVPHVLELSTDGEVHPG